MKARLRFREMGQTRFGEMPDAYPTIAAAEAAGEHMSTNGNVDEFEVWVLKVKKRRKWKLEEVK